MYVSQKEAWSTDISATMSRQTVRKLTVKCLSITFTDADDMSLAVLL